MHRQPASVHLQARLASQLIPLQLVCSALVDRLNNLLASLLVAHPPQILLPLAPQPQRLLLLSVSQLQVHSAAPCLAPLTTVSPSTYDTSHLIRPTVKGTDPFEVNQRVEDPKGPDRITDRVKFHSITTESKFMPFSFEELRTMDYSRGTKNSSQAPSTAGFGASTSGGFGSAFGASNPAGGTSAFGQSAGTGFGSNQGTGGGLFGASQPQQNTAFGGSSTGGGLFGQTQSQPAAGGGLFGQSNTQSTPFGGGAATGGAFGQQAPKPSLFGRFISETICFILTKFKDLHQLVLHLVVELVVALLLARVTLRHPHRLVNQALVAVLAATQAQLVAQASLSVCLL